MRKAVSANRRNGRRKAKEINKAEQEESPKGSRNAVVQSSGGGGDGSGEGSSPAVSTPNTPHHHHHPERRPKLSQDEAALTAKNYRLAKELSELRVRHREECKTVTKLTMENMNLASRCREAVGHVARLKRELALQQKRAADAIAVAEQQQQQLEMRKGSPWNHDSEQPVQKQPQPAEDDNLQKDKATENEKRHSPLSTASPPLSPLDNQQNKLYSTPSRKSSQPVSVDGDEDDDSMLSPKTRQSARSAALAAEMDRFDRILAAAVADASPKNSPAERHVLLAALDKDSSEKANIMLPTVATTREPFTMHTPPSSPRHRSLRLVSSDDYEEESSDTHSDLHTTSSRSEPDSPEGPPTANGSSAATTTDPEQDTTVSQSSTGGLSTPTRETTLETRITVVTQQDEEAEEQANDAEDEELISGEGDDVVGETPRPADVATVTEPKAFFPNSASPKIGRGGYNEEFPGDIMASNRSGHAKRRPNHLGGFREADDEDISPSSSSAKSTGKSPTPFEKLAQREGKSDIMSSIDAFEASFSMNIADSFSPRDDGVAEEKKSSVGDIYNPFSPSPQRPGSGKQNGVLTDFAHLQEQEASSMAGSVRAMKERLGMASSQQRQVAPVRPNRRKLADPPGFDKTSRHKTTFKPFHETNHTMNNNTSQNTHNYRVVGFSNHTTKSPISVVVSKVRNYNGAVTSGTPTSATESSSSAFSSNSTTGRPTVNSEAVKSMNPPPFLNASSLNNAATTNRGAASLPAAPASRVARGVGQPQRTPTQSKIVIGSEGGRSPTPPPPTQLQQQAQTSSLTTTPTSSINSTGAGTSPGYEAARARYENAAQPAPRQGTAPSRGVAIERMNSQEDRSTRSVASSTARSNMQDDLTSRSLASPTPSGASSDHSTTSNSKERPDLSSPGGSKSVKERVAAYVEQTQHSPSSHKTGWRREGTEIPDIPDDEDDEDIPMHRPNRVTGLSSSLAKQLESRKANAAAAVAEAVAASHTKHQLPFDTSLDTNYAPSHHRLRARPWEPSNNNGLARRGDTDNMADSDMRDNTGYLDSRTKRTVAQLPVTSAPFGNAGDPNGFVARRTGTAQY